MILEQQLEKLADIGLHLNPDVSIDDLMYSFEREAFENTPFDLLLFTLGMEVEREPWGRRVSNHAWDFDTECIYQTGDYVTIVKNLCRLSGNENYLKDVSDYVNLNAQKAWLKYTREGQPYHMNVEVNDDWVDTMAMSNIIEDIERDGKRFYFKDNGQAMIIFYLDEKTAQELNKLSNNALEPLSVD
ncbi:hypothetical protein BKI52_16615 [marine bacterium AO1-C]|nr:hypothetical protein BKI52_16615 [marine bacterium AO1-C]